MKKKLAALAVAGTLAFGSSAAAASDANASPQMQFSSMSSQAVDSLFNLPEIIDGLPDLAQYAIYMPFFLSSYALAFSSNRPTCTGLIPTPC